MNAWVVVTYGSLAVGIGLLVYHFVTWWPGRKALMKDPMCLTSLVPFLLGYAYGALLVMGVGGLMGWMAGAVIWGVGWVGDAALVYGVGGARETLGQGQVMALTNGGLWMVLVMTFLIVALRRRTAHLKEDIGRGVLTGVLTGSTPLVAGALAVPLASAVNLAGAWISTGSAGA
jgi:hypothetical protein